MAKFFSHFVLMVGIVIAAAVCFSGLEALAEGSDNREDSNSGSYTPGNYTQNSLGSTTTGQCNITSGSTNPCTLDLTGSTNGAITEVYSSADFSTTACVRLAGCYNAVRSDPGSAIAPIDVWNACRYVDNTSSGATAASNFVPFHSAFEWKQFYSYNPSTLSVVHCSRPFPLSTMWTVPSPSTAGLSTYSTANCSDTPSVNAPTIYNRWYSSTNFGIWPTTPESTQFTTCHGGWTTINAQVLWSGQESADSATPAASWWPVVTYGPDLTLAASATTRIGSVSGSTITVLAGTSVTLSWDASLSDTTTAQESLPLGVTSTLNGTSGNNVTNTTGTSFASTKTPTVTGAVTVTSLGSSSYAIASNGTTNSASVTVIPFTALGATTSAVGYSITDAGDKTVSSIANIIVNVEQPVVLSLTTNPSGNPATINLGDPITLIWTVTNPPPNPTNPPPVSCTLSNGDGTLSESVAAASGSQTVYPTTNETYTLTCSDPVQNPTTEVPVVVCPSGYMDWNNVCTAITYTVSYNGGPSSCPTACGEPASTITPSCTRNPDGASVALSDCRVSVTDCSATASCGPPVATVWETWSCGGNYCYISMQSSGYNYPQQSWEYTGSQGRPVANEIGSQSLYGAAYWGVAGTFGGGSLQACSASPYNLQYNTTCGAYQAHPISCSYVWATSITDWDYVGYGSIRTANPYGPTGTQFQIWDCDGVMRDGDQNPLYSVP